MLNRSRFLVERGHILRPIVDFIIGFVAPWEAPNRPVVVVELHMIIEDLGLHLFSSQRRRESVFIRFNRCKAGFTHSKRCIAEHGEWVLRQFQEGCLVLIPKFLDGNLVLIVEPVGILFAPLPEVFIKFLKRGNDRNWNEALRRL